MPQGSVAVDGVSLTIVDIERAAPCACRSSLTPSRPPRCRDLRVGAEVNLEADVIGKYVRAYLIRSGASPGLTFEKLSEAGFL